MVLEYTCSIRIDKSISVDKRYQYGLYFLPFQVSRSARFYTVQLKTDVRAENEGVRCSETYVINERGTRLCSLTTS